MINRQVDGLIIASTQKNQKEILNLKKSNIPFVLIDRHYPEIKTNYVIVDNYQGMRNATEHLIKLGRKRIAFVTLKAKLTALTERHKGYKEALEMYNIPINNTSFVELSSEGYPNEMGDAIRFLISKVGIDAIIFSTNILAVAGIRELNQLGVSIPEKVATLSFDEMGAFDIIAPPITAIRQPVKDIGLQSTKILLDTIKGKDSNILKKQVLNTELVVRKSCGS